jgi:hypothetical protein
MGLPKNVIYRFVDDPRSDELEVDHSGALRFRAGEILGRGGKFWRVDSIRWELSSEHSQRVPTLRVYLTRAPVN